MYERAGPEDQPRMTSDSSQGRDTPLSGHPQYDLGEWMINQQRQFQEFDRSFDRTFHTTPAFGNTFGDFFSPFSRPNLALQSSQQQLPPSSTHAYPTAPDRAMAQSSDMSPKAKVSYDADKFQVEFNVEDYTPEVGLNKQRKCQQAYNYYAGAEY